MNGDLSTIGGVRNRKIAVPKNSGMTQPTFRFVTGTCCSGSRSALFAVPGAAALPISPLITAMTARIRNDQISVSTKHAASSAAVIR